MAITFLQLFAPNVVGSAAAEVLYTVPPVPSSTILRNGRVRFCNTTAGAVTIKAWAVPPSGSASDSNMCLPDTSISANEYLDIDVPTMSAGYTLRAQAGAASSITATNLDGFLQS